MLRKYGSTVLIMIYIMHCYGGDPSPLVIQTNGSHCYLEFPSNFIGNTMN